ncbi:MAG: hypothetical protein GYA02_16775 [Clostridiaceae bacterium]|jgi:uncharacterized membrane protein|nr:hypothetical protein [Clostridiaceae bacterium]
MEFLKRFPYVLATFMGIVVGTISYASNIENDEIYIRMLICIIVFYFLGLFIRYFIFTLQKDIEKKKTQNEEKDGIITGNIAIDALEENNESEWTNLHETVKKVGEQ